MNFPRLRPLSRLLLLTLLGLGSLVRPEERSPAQPTPAPVLRIGLGTVGAVEEALAGRLRDHLQQYLRLDVHALPAQAADDRPLREWAKMTRPAEDYLVVLLVAGAPPQQPHGFLDPTNRVAVVHVDAQRHEDAETFARRLDKQVTRGAAYLLGLTTCPNPRCALFPYRNNTELDAIGRTVCPPCSDLLSRKVRETGLAQRPWVMPENIRKKIEERRRAQGLPPLPAPGATPPISPP
jgi:hypothetical protein